MEATNMPIDRWKDKEVAVNIYNGIFSSAQSCPNLCDLMDCSMPGFLSIESGMSSNYFIVVSIESVMPSNYFILCCPLLLLPSIFPSIRIFSNESALHIMWPKYCSFRFSISPSNEESVDFPQDWLVWSACCSRHSQESSPAPQFEGISSSALSFLCGPTLTSIITTWKNIVLIICTYVNKVMSMLLNILSRFVIVSLLRSKRFLISWLQSLSAVIFGGQEIKSFTASTFCLFSMKWWDRMPRS